MAMLALAVGVALLSASLTTTLSAPPAAADASVPLMGDTNIENHLTRLGAGVAIAYKVTASGPAQLNAISVFVDASTATGKFTVGVYADGNATPGTLLGQATINGVTKGAWNHVPVPAVPLIGGAKYWLAVLAPTGSGGLGYRDKCCTGSPALMSYVSGAALPASWTTAATTPSAPLSMYASGVRGPIISAVDVPVIDDAKATITWTTHVPATTQIDYGPTASYGAVTPLESTLVTAHRQTISGLIPGATYHFRVRSQAGGFTTTSADMTFKTTGPAAVTGQWEAPMTWPLVGVHMSLMANGKVLVWDAWETPTLARVYDPADQSFTTVAHQRGLFCSGMVHLPDGRILVVGGHDVQHQQQGLVLKEAEQYGSKQASIFDPATNTWTQVADMHYARWYPSVTTLADGRVLAISGQDAPGTFSDTPEVYDPATDTWTALTGIATVALRESQYPMATALSNGKVLVIGPQSGGTFLLDPELQTWTYLGTAPVKNGSSTMFRPDQILFAGGASAINQPSRAGAATLDMTSPGPTWRPVAPLIRPRSFQPTVVLPDGTVAQFGGATAFDTASSSFEGSSEIWDPTTGASTRLPAMASGRGYHSTALLMPDGRVLVAGGGRIQGSPNNFTAQYYSPAYLFNGPRPTITSAPSEVGYASAFAVQTPDASRIAQVSLVRLPAETHTSDMDQRFLPLTFTAGPGTLSIDAPSGAGFAPPGPYMLFILDTNGVPSVASMLTLSSAAESSAVVAQASYEAAPFDAATATARISEPGLSFHCQLLGPAAATALPGRRRDSSVGA